MAGLSGAGVFEESGYRINTAQQAHESFDSGQQKDQIGYAKRREKKKVFERTTIETEDGVRIK